MSAQQAPTLYQRRQTTINMLDQLSGPILPMPANETTRKTQVQASKDYFALLKTFVLNMAKDYKTYGSFYHNLPFRDRYHPLAKENGIADDAQHDFIVSNGADLPVMITILETSQTLLSETEALLQDPVSLFELDGVSSRLMRVVSYINQAWWIMGKITATMGFYEHVILPDRRRNGDWGAETGKYKDRKFRQAQKWSDALPQICSGTIPAVADVATVRREATRTVLAATAWAEGDPAKTGRPRARERRATS